MRVSDLEVDSRIVEILSKEGIENLYPPQAEAIGPALEGKNVVLAIPTASGKSLVAYLAVLQSVLRKGKALYIVPLRALASEKYEDLKVFEAIGVRVGVSIGDYDAPDPTLEKFDIIIATSEKADSLLRHRAHWLQELSVVVADEIHLIDDPGRGPTLEVTLSKLKQINPSAQILALSATIKNSNEIAEWLGAEHIASDWRPVPLKEGIFYEGQITFVDGSRKVIEECADEVSSLVLDVVKDGGQCLVFVNTRRSSEALSGRVGSFLRDVLKPETTKRLSVLSRKLLSRQDEPTSLGARLSRRIRHGAAFHHAGLTNDQRKMVEAIFKSGLLKCIVATPTLAAGINLPARRVVVRDLTRFDPNYGNVPIPVMEVKQMSGRAGRPQYDKEGEAILLAKKPGDSSFIMENYLLQEPESIDSKLGQRPALRMHMLSSIATSHVRNEEELHSFIENTFFAQKTDVWTIFDMIDDILEFLVEEGFIEANDRFRATFFGKRTSDLYIDPLSALTLRNALGEESRSTFAYLHAICATPDIPTLYLRRGDYEWVEELAANEEFLVEYDDYEFFLSEVKTAALLQDWIDEEPADAMTKRFGIGPGDIRRWVDMAEWLVYSMKELSRLFDKSRTRILDRLMPRVRYGVKEELLDLVSLRGIGRARARSLFNHGYKTLEDLKKADVRALSRLPLIGTAIARNVKLQLGESMEKGEEEKMEGQSIFYDFRGE
ncbi:MAG: DEAD/DEAH box helicase [Thermoplasmata archaeon]